jgi:cytidylate kinase
MGAPVVTISATFGAGGSVIAPAVADKLGLPFLDRMVSADLAEAVTRSGESLSEAESRATPHNRFFAYLAHAAPIGATVVPPVETPDDAQTVRERAEDGIAELREARGGVVLGRAGAVVLKGQPATYHVRLDGPPARRIERAAALEGVDVEEARHHLEVTDRARKAYVKRLYRADAADPALYHLVIDTTVLPIDAAVRLVVDAVTSSGLVG